jgi:hypothetical protein
MNERHDESRSELLHFSAHFALTLAPQEIQERISLLIVSQKPCSVSRNAMFSLFSLALVRHCKNLGNYEIGQFVPAES